MEQTTTLDGNVEEMLNSYKDTPQSLVNITYQSPSYSHGSPIAKGFEKIRGQERDLDNILAEKERIERTILVQHGYEQVPTWFRGIEAARRYAVSFATKGEKDAERIVELAKHSSEHLKGLIGSLTATIPEYDRMKTKVQTYRHELQDRIIDISEKHSDTITRLDTLTKAIETYEQQRDPNSSLQERTVWKRTYEAMQDDRRKLESFRLRTTTDLDQSIALEEVAGHSIRALDTARTMNEVAAIKAGYLQRHLSINIDLYATNSSVTDIAARVGTQLNEASKLSDLLTKSTQHRMEALTVITKDFSMPNGKGASSIASGGVLEGLRAHLAEMQHFADGELQERLERY